MDHTIVPVSQWNEKQILDLARLHQRALHSLLADLGLPFVERYYRIACGEPGVIGFCAVSGSGSPLGWAIGSSKPDQINGRLREACVWFSLQMLRVLFAHPRVLGQLFASARNASVTMPEYAIELTYIGVEPSARGHGLGRGLLHAFTQAARDANYRSVVLSVEAENESAIALYTKAGFQIIASFTEGNFHRHRMALEL